MFKTVSAANYSAKCNIIPGSTWNRSGNHRASTWIQTAGNMSRLDSYLDDTYLLYYKKGKQTTILENSQMSWTTPDHFVHCYTAVMRPVLEYWPDCKPEGPLFSAEFVCLSVCLSVCWPDCKPEGPLFSAEFVCLCVRLSVCLKPALLPFNVNRFSQNLVTRNLLWSSLAATIMVQIGRRGTMCRFFENFEKILNHRIQISKFWSIIFCICVPSPKWPIMCLVGR